MTQLTTIAQNAMAPAFTSRVPGGLAATEFTPVTISWWHVNADRTRNRVRTRHAAGAGPHGQLRRPGDADPAVRHRNGVQPVRHGPDREEVRRAVLQPAARDPRDPRHPAGHRGRGAGVPRGSGEVGRGAGHVHRRTRRHSGRGRRRIVVRAGRRRRRVARHGDRHRGRHALLRRQPGDHSARQAAGMSVENLVSSGPLILAIPVAAAAGALTFLSPCCLPLVPGYLSYITGMSGAGAEGAGASQAGAEPAAAQLASAQAVGVQPGGARLAGAAPVSVGGPSVAVPAPPPRSRVVAGTALFVLGFSALYMSYGLAFGGLGTA